MSTWADSSHSCDQLTWVVPCCGCIKYLCSWGLSHNSSLLLRSLLVSWAKHSKTFLHNLLLTSALIWILQLDQLFFINTFPSPPGTGSAYPFWHGTVPGPRTSSHLLWHPQAPLLTLPTCLGALLHLCHVPDGLSHFWNKRAFQRSGAQDRKNFICLKKTYMGLKPP